MGTEAQSSSGWAYPTTGHTVSTKPWLVAVSIKRLYIMASGDPVDRIRALQEKLRRIQSMEFPKVADIKLTPRASTPAVKIAEEYQVSTPQTETRPTPISKATPTDLWISPRQKAAELRTRDRVIGLQRTQQILRSQTDVLNELLVDLDISPRENSETVDEKNEGPIKRLDDLRTKLLETNILPKPGYGGRYPSPNVRRMIVPKPTLIAPIYGSFDCESALRINPI